MSEDGSKSAGGPNWLFGVDKLTTPTLEFLGVKIRDSVRSYLNSKARERVSLRKFEREFFIRQSELLYYGADQYALTFISLEKELLDRAFARFDALLIGIAKESAVTPTRVAEVVTDGFLHRESVDLKNAHEIAVYHSAAMLMETLISSYSSQALFHHCLVPSTVHRQNPEVDDEELDTLMNDSGTLDQIQKELELPNHEIAERIVKSICIAFEQPYHPTAES